jgi:uncharacterized protein YdeI (YjbR/CyaY-like superfamily)
MLKNAKTTQSLCPRKLSPLHRLIQSNPVQICYTKLSVMSITKVDTFMDQLDHPLKKEMEKVISIITTANPKIESDIKWGGPSFKFKEDMATLNPKIKNYVAVIFHKAALLNDDFGFLEEQTKGKAYAKFYNMADVDQHGPALKRAVNAWVSLMENS